MGEAEEKSRDRQPEANNQRMNKFEPLSFEEIEKLVEPLFDLSRCERISLNSLRNNYETIIAKLHETGYPVLLTMQGQSLFLCDPESFKDLEERRRRILEGCKAVENKPRTVRLSTLLSRLTPVQDTRIQKLRQLKARIGSETQCLKALDWDRQRIKKNVSDWEAEAEKLANEMKNENSTKGDSGCDLNRRSDSTRKS
jgi:hypothetical protein